MEITSSLRRGLIDRLGQERFDLWFGRGVQFDWQDSQLIVSAHDQFVLDRIRRRFREDLNSLLIEILGRPSTTTFIVSQRTVEVDSHSANLSSDAAPVRAPSSADKSPTGDRPSLVQSNRSTAKPPEGRDEADNTAIARRSYHDLESLVLGDSNRLAVTAAQMITTQVGKVSPVLIYGPNGCGKTHLLEGLLKRIRQTRCVKRSILVSAEQFTSHFLESLQSSSLPSFRRKYRDLDILLIDDIQFFQGKRATLVELQHTIDAVCRNGRQIVLSSDRAPGELAALGSDLLAKITGGLVCGVDPLDYAMRFEIVCTTVKRRGLECPVSVCELIARELSGDGRQLAGAVNRLEAASQALSQDISLEFAQAQLADIFQVSCRLVRFPDIERAVCEVYGLEKSSLTNSSNSKELTEPRMLAMWLARKYTRAALSEIGKFFGGRSHSTVISAQKRMANLIENGAPTKATPAKSNLPDVVRRVEQRLRIAN